MMLLDGVEKMSMMKDTEVVKGLMPMKSVMLQSRAKRASARHAVKLTVYRHFMNTLVFAAMASVIFMVWSLVYHIFPTCLKDWKELWVDTAFWHVLFCFILIVIVILWRPSVNNQRYAFTPLLDDSEDENDQDEIFNASTPGFEMLKQRESGSGADVRRQREKEREEYKLQV
ncbi:unnamed protein product [Heligmosomoides polygyrus]|uniref:Transmembrane protein 87B n=1 Tax=Heligmosomoides polygyrus TaxID=6339 RepID=A0A183F9K1_HELPZ|nr:unnamed protein product [Heligmosomoides polygyrus]